MSVNFLFLEKSVLPFPAAPDKFISNLLLFFVFN